MKSLGKAFRPHGLKGGVIFRVDGGCPDEYVREQLTPGAVVVLVPLDGAGPEVSAMVERVIFGKKILLYLEGYGDRNAIEGRLPFELRVERAEGDFPDDVLGFRVYSEQTGEEVGSIAAIGSNGVQDIWEVRGRENFSIPRVPRFVKKIDKEGKKVFVWIPEYEEA